MNARNILVSEGLTALQENQELNVYMQTPDGKKARKAAEQEIRVSVQNHSDRSAANAETFTQQLFDRLAQVKALTTELHNLRRRMRSDLSPAEFDALQEQFFSAEAAVNSHMGWVLEREQRVESITEQLADPVASLSALQAKFPSTRRPYLAPFGR
ncbi:hypothetical protein GCM10027403_14860 [Arthrobacter tecti]